MTDFEAECAGFEFFGDVEWVGDSGATVFVGFDGFWCDVLGLFGPAVPAAGVGAGFDS